MGEHNLPSSITPYQLVKASTMCLPVTSTTIMHAGDCFRLKPVAMVLFMLFNALSVKLLHLLLCCVV